MEMTLSELDDAVVVVVVPVHAGSPLGHVKTWALTKTRVDVDVVVVDDDDDDDIAIATIASAASDRREDDGRLLVLLLLV